MYYQTKIKSLIAGGAIDVNGKRLQFIGNNPAQVGDMVWTDGFYRKNRYVTYNNHLYVHRYSYTQGHENESLPEKYVHSVCYSVSTYVGQQIELGIDIPDEDTDVIFYRDGEKFNQLNLKQFADEAENLALEVKDKIMAKSAENIQAANADIIAKGIPTTEILNYFKQPSPPDDFIASTYARVAMLKIQPNGDYDAVIVASSYGYCFPYLTFNGSAFLHSFPNGENASFNSDLEQCMQIFENNVFDEEISPRTLPVALNIIKYPRFTGDKKDDDGNYTDEYKRYILNKVAYYIPRARFKYKNWYKMLFNSFLVLKVHNGNITDTIYSNSGGGHSLWKYERDWDEKTYSNETVEDFIIADNETTKEFEFPLDEGYYLVSDGLRVKKN